MEDDEARRPGATDAIASLSDAELAERAGAPLAYVAALRSARDLDEARDIAASLAEAPAMNAAPEAEPTLTRFLELVETDALDTDAARAILRELQAVGGDLRALRIALTGRGHGPELRAVLVALGGEEAARRASIALASV